MNETTEQTLERLAAVGTKLDEIKTDIQRLADLAAAQAGTPPVVTAAIQALLDKANDVEDDSEIGEEPPAPPAEGEGTPPATPPTE